jgi:hypothetical protein
LWGSLWGSLRWSLWGSLRGSLWGYPYCENHCEDPREDHCEDPLEDPQGDHCKDFCWHYYPCDRKRPFNLCLSTCWGHTIGSLTSALRSLWRPTHSKPLGFNVL